jgi:hypothetical protein
MRWLIVERLPYQAQKGFKKVTLPHVTQREPFAGKDFPCHWHFGKMGL